MNHGKMAQQRTNVSLALVIAAGIALATMSGLDCLNEKTKHLLGTLP
jgi:hypothetical protein